MKLVIVEDEPQASERLQHLIGQLRPGTEVVAILDSVAKSIAWLKENSADLILMDIQLSDGLSFEIFEAVQVKAPIIFTTAYNEYALKAFKVNSIDYILKPVDKEEFKAALDKYDGLKVTLDPSRMMESISNAMQMLARRYKERFCDKSRRAS